MLNIKNMDEVMNKDYTMIIDGKSPAGMIKFRNEATQEIVYVVVNETLAENTLKVMAVNANANAIVDHASENKEDNTMAQNNNTQATQAQATNNNTSKKEEKKMTLKERWMANLKKGEDLGYKAANKTGYAVGYAAETVKDEAAYAAQKVKGAVCGTKVAKEFSNGYYDGKNNAYYDFVQRSVQREAKAREKANSKAMKQAVNELLSDADICM